MTYGCQFNYAPGSFGFPLSSDLTRTKIYDWDGNTLTGRANAPAVADHSTLPDWPNPDPPGGSCVTVICDKDDNPITIKIDWFDCPVDLPELGIPPVNGDDWTDAFEFAVTNFSEVRFPPGRYAITRDVRIPGHRRITGCEQTVIELRDQARLIAGDAPGHVTMERLEFDLSGKTTVGRSALMLQVPDITLDDIIFRDMVAGSPIRIFGRSELTPGATDARNIRLQNLRFYDCGDPANSTSGGGDHAIFANHDAPGLIIDNCQFERIGGNFVWVGTDCHGSIVSNCTGTGSGRLAYELFGGDDPDSHVGSTLVNCQAVDTAWWAFSVAGVRGGSMVNCFADGTGSFGAELMNTADGLMLGVRVLNCDTIGLISGSNPAIANEVTNHVTDCHVSGAGSFGAQWLRAGPLSSMSDCTFEDFGRNLSQPTRGVMTQFSPYMRIKDNGFRLGPTTPLGPGIAGVYILQGTETMVSGNYTIAPVGTTVGGTDGVVLNGSAPVIDDGTNALRFI